MATRLEDEFDPTRINAPDAAYPAGSLKDATTPGVSDDGTPLASRVGNDWQGFSQSALDKAGIAANGQPDSVSNPQILQAIEHMYNDGDSQLAAGPIWPLNSQESAQDGDDLTGYEFIRLQGGDFSSITIFKMSAQTGPSDPFSGAINSINITTEPYTAIVGGTPIYLRVLKFGIDDGYTFEEFGLSESTPDASLVISAALEFIPDGSKIISTGGPYKLTSKATVTGKRNLNVEARYPGWELNENFTGTMLDFINSDHITFENCYVNGLVNDNNIDRPSFIGLDGSDFFTLKDSIIFDCYFGVAIISESNNGKILDNYCYGTAVYNPSEELRIVSALAYAQFDGNDWEVRGNYATNINSLTLGGGTLSWRVVNNEAFETIDSSIYLFNSGHIVTGNIIERAGKDGIKILDNINPAENKNNIISNNIVIDSGIVKSDGGVGISSAGTRNVVSGNVVEMGDGVGFASTSFTGVFHNGPYSTINDNTVLSDDNSISGSGITISTATSECSGSQASNNTVTGVKQGISLQQSSTNDANNITIDENTITGAENGVIATSSDRTLFKALNVSNNNFFECVESVSFFNSSNGLLDPNVEYNTVSDNSGFAFRLNGDLGGLEFRGNRTDGSESSTISGDTSLYKLLDNISGDTPLNDNIVGIQQTFSMDTDTFVTFTPPYGQGALVSISASFGLGNGLASIRLSGGDNTELLTVGALMEVASGPLNGTTGTAGKLTVSVSNGVGYIENRLGSTRSVTYHCLISG